MFASHKDQFEEKNPVVVGAVSAAAGIALGTTAAMYLSKKDNRKKLMNSLEVVRGRAQDVFKTLVSKTENSTNEIMADAKSTIKSSMRNKTLKL